MRRSVIPIALISALLCAGAAFVSLQGSRQNRFSQVQTRRLWEAVQRGDPVGVRQALAKGGDPNAAEEVSQPSLAGLFLQRPPGQPGTPVLVAAAEAGSAPVVEALLEGGANPNSRRSDGHTALMQAALAGKIPIVQSLLDHRADINAADKEGDTPLIRCLQSDQALAAARFLLAHGADVKRQGKQGDSALREALVANRRDLVEEVLKHGADANTRGIDTAGSFTINGITWSNAGGTALMLASRNAETDLMRALLDHGADIDARDAEGRTALTWTAFLNHADAARLLLRRGAGPAIPDAHGQTALDIARALRARDVEKILQKLQ